MPALETGSIIMRKWLQCGKITYIKTKAVGSSVKSHPINQE